MGRNKPNWALRKRGRPRKKIPRIGRSNYDEFRSNEILDVTWEIKRFIDRIRLREKPAGRRGRPPIKKRDILKSLLFIELMTCSIPRAPSLLLMHKEILGLDRIPAARTLYKYRAQMEMTKPLERLVYEAGKELFSEEEIAATDGTGHGRSKGKTWSGDRSNPMKYREYDMAHYLVGTKTNVILAARITRGTWHDSRQFKPLLDLEIPGTNLRAITADPGYISRDNYDLVEEMGFTPYIKPKNNAVFRPHPKNAYEKAVMFATRFPKRWHNTYRYRTKAECAIHSVKATFGDIIRGRHRTSRRNQVLCRVIVHNMRMTVMDRYGE